ncbi:MAG: riboflavin biosynthesis protein RibF, partial [Clostridiales bacterium]|nr:riboflavin biosynthesis protein RibF [Clostridiales bacterium]
HLGHKALLSCAVELANACDGQAVALTFSNHPMTLLGQDVPLLTNNICRAALLQQQGVEVDMIPFTKELASLDPAAFVSFLQSRFAAPVRAVVVGENYRFGKAAAGTPELLRELGPFETVIVPTVCQDGAPISSSRIRLLLAEAKLGETAQLLGRPYAVCGLVVREKGLATRLGFPTANLTATGDVPLPNGVYLSRVTLDGQAHPAVTNIGYKPTVGGKSRSVETHIIDLTTELDDQWLTAEQLAYLRPEQTFVGLDALRAQVERDIRTAKELYLSFSKEN